jgi:hypothetical protein
MLEKMGLVKKRNHYLPRAYLQGFCDQEGLLWTFDRISKEFRHLPPDSVAVEKEFYIVRDSAGRKSNVVEDRLATSENAAIPIIRELDSPNRRLSEQEREVLAQFIALLRLRTTVFNAEMEEVIEHYTSAIVSDLFKDETSARDSFAKLAGNGAAMPSERLEALVSMWKSGQYTVKVNREYIIHLMLQRTDSFAEELFAMTWGILRSHQQASFITGDLPWSILTIDPTKSTDFGFRDIFLPHVRTVVPLTKSTAVMLEARVSGSPKVRYGRVFREFNRTVNRPIADNAQRFVFSGNEALLRRLVKSTRIDLVDRPVRFYAGTEGWLKPDADQILGITVAGA